MVQYRAVSVFKETFSKDFANVKSELVETNETPKKTYKHEYRPGAIIFLTAIHLVLGYYIIQALMFRYNMKYFVYQYTYTMFMGLGVTVGVHRLWSHRSYTANLPVRIFLMCCQSGSMQTNIYQWVRDHRVHHRFSDTDADPHNSTRGIFFSHCGWLCVKKHPDVKEKGKLVDMSDVLDDPVVKFQIKYYAPLAIIFCFIIPMSLQMYIFPECTIWTAFFNRIGIYTVLLHWVWSVNSFAHFYGVKPYDKRIRPTQNIVVSILALGEGWHNYHHAFPWDYKTAELGNYRYNFSTAVIDFFAAIGWVTDLKFATKDMILSRIMRTGDMTLATPEIRKELEARGIFKR